MSPSICETDRARSPREWSDFARDGRSLRGPGNRDGRRCRRRERLRRAASARIASGAAGVRTAADARRGHELEQRPVVREAFAQVGVQVDRSGLRRRSCGQSRSLTSGLEFRGGDRLKADAVAGLDREVAGFDVDDAEGRRSEQVPAAGRSAGIDRRLPAGDGDRARRDLQSGRIAPGEVRRERGVDSPRREIRAESRPRRRRSRPSCESRSTSSLVNLSRAATIVKVGSVVKHRDHQPAACGSRDSAVGFDRAEPRFQLEQIDLFRVGEDGHRSISENDVSDARPLP